MSVTAPQGFMAAGVTAGFKPSGQPDLALLVGVPGTTATGLFTTNIAAAAPVGIARERLVKGGGRAVLVNSGQANAATGERGERDARAITEEAAGLLGIEAEDMIPCSTGVIGEPLHLDVFSGGLRPLVHALAPDGGDAFARAIMTTDTVPKSAVSRSGAFVVGGAAKGVGMISPRLATMLAFVTTDAPIAAPDLRLLAETELKPLFNAITVDACPSTNDTVLLLASGAAANDVVRPDDVAWEGLAAAVGEVGRSLCSQLIADAEGGTHVVIVEVDGAADDADARTIARAVADSPLVKTAVFGQDPNPGRILQAVGSSGVELHPSLIDVWIGGARLVEGGVIPPSYFETGGLRASAKEAMAAQEFTVRARVGSGPGSARILGCDLSYEYVRINGEYTT